MNHVSLSPLTCLDLFLAQLLTHLTLPDEVYYTVKAKVALPYLAMGADGKSMAWLIL